jgi:osmotically inducible lipoprotein OsmB
VPRRGAGEEGSLEVKRSILAIVVIGAFATTGCANMSQTEQRTVTGAAGGAAAGAIIGAIAGNAGLGAAIGGAVGGTGGFLYGKAKEAEANAYQQGVQAGRSGQ